MPKKRLNIESSIQKLNKLNKSKKLKYDNENFEIRNLTKCFEVLHEKNFMLLKDFYFLFDPKLKIYKLNRILNILTSYNFKEDIDFKIKILKNIRYILAPNYNSALFEQEVCEAYEATLEEEYKEEYKLLI